MGPRVVILALSGCGYLASIATFEWAEQSGLHAWEVRWLLGLIWLLVGVLSIQRVGGTAREATDSSTLLGLVARFQQMKFEAGADILREGDPADRFYILSKGRVRVHREDEYGSEIVLGELVPGDFFGEIGLLTGLPRTASITAMDDVEVLSVTSDEFSELVKHSRQLEADLHRTSMERFKGRASQ